MVSTFNKQKAIAKVMQRSVSRMNNDITMREDAERFGDCSVGIVIKNLYGERLGDFHGSYVNGSFKVNIRGNTKTDYDAIVTITEDAFMNLCTGKITPEYAFGTNGIHVEGRIAYKLAVVGIGVGELLYSVLKD
jgi:putative sterol carrier protein